MNDQLTLNLSDTMTMRDAERSWSLISRDGNEVSWLWLSRIAQWAAYLAGLFGLVGTGVSLALSFLAGLAKRRSVRRCFELNLS